METRKEGSALPPWLPVGLLQAGQIFAGRYRVEGLLGGGWSSQVHEAVNIVDGRKVAIKAFHRQLLPSAGAVKRFEFVMRAERRVNGPHVANTLEAGIDPQTQIPFIITEFLSGETLESAVRRKGPMGARKMVECMRQIAAGLEVGHAKLDRAAPEQGPIVHGNLKPSTIFLERQQNGPPVVTLLDFGLAEALERSRDAGGRGGLGPPAYTAYEQICGYAVTPRADVWAYALVAFFVMTGHHYWCAANGDLDDARRRRELFDEVLNRRLVPPSFRVRELGVDVRVPPKFDAWFARCLEREPELRFDSARAAFDELERAFQPRGAWLVHLLVARTRWAVASLVVGLAVLITLVLAGRF
jgi:serine/threonine protein kinase